MFRRDFLKLLPWPFLTYGKAIILPPRPETWVWEADSFIIEKETISFSRLVGFDRVESLQTKDTLEIFVDSMIFELTNVVHIKGNTFSFSKMECKKWK